jgi:VanZ family protein
MVKKNKFSLILALIIAYLSLANSKTFSEVPLYNIPFADKIVHFIMYFSLMSVIIFENRKYLKSTGQLIFLALIPFLYGALMEILQSTLTISRSGSIYDAAANLAGVVTSVLLWFLIKPFFMKDNFI